MDSSSHDTRRQHNKARTRPRRPARATGNSNQPQSEPFPTTSRQRDFDASSHSHNGPAHSFATDLTRMPGAYINPRFFSNAAPYANSPVSSSNFQHHSANDSSMPPPTENAPQGHASRSHSARTHNEQSSDGGWRNSNVPASGYANPSPQSLPNSEVPLPAHNNAFHAGNGFAWPQLPFNNGFQWPPRPFPAGGSLPWPPPFPVGNNMPWPPLQPPFSGNIPWPPPPLPLGSQIPHPPPIDLMSAPLGYYPDIHGPSQQSLQTAGPSKASSRRGQYKDPRVFLLERPVPSPDYVRRISLGYKPSPQAPLLIILDLNGVLIYRSRNGSKTSFEPRPDLDVFLSYLFARHHVMVWSSGVSKYVTKICQDLFTAEQFDSLIGIWARDKLRLTPSASAQNVQVYKQLRWVWEDRDLQKKASMGTSLCEGAVTGGVYGQENTVLIDDSLEKAAAEPHNLLQVDEFKGAQDQARKGVDKTLMRVVHYLEKLDRVTNVTAYMKENPFYP